MSTEPQGTMPASMTNRQVENAAIAYVLAHEEAAGRSAVDTRSEAASPVDVRSHDARTDETRLIEVKAFGTSVRGEFLWLEPIQIETGRKDPRFHLYIVENIRSGDPATFRLIDVHGEALQDLLSGAKEKHYFEVPVRVGTYAQLIAGHDGSELTPEP